MSKRRRSRKPRPDPLDERRGEFRRRQKAKSMSPSDRRILKFLKENGY